MEGGGALVQLIWTACLDEIVRCIASLWKGKERKGKVKKY